MADSKNAINVGMSNIPINYRLLIRQEADATHNPINVIAHLPESFNMEQDANYESPFADFLLGNSTVNTVAQMMGVKLVNPLMTMQIWGGSSIPHYSIDFDLISDINSQGEPLLAQDTLYALLSMNTPYMDKEKAEMITAPGPTVDWKTISKDLQQLDNEIGAAARVAARAWNVGIDASLALLPNEDEDSKDTINAIGGQAKINTYTKVDGSSKDWGKTYSSDAVLGTEVYKDSGEKGGGGIDYDFTASSIVKRPISMRLGRYLFFPSIVITNVSWVYSHAMDINWGLPIHIKVSMQFKPLIVPTIEHYATMFHYNATVRGRAKAKELRGIKEETKKTPAQMDQDGEFSRG